MAEALNLVNAAAGGRPATRLLDGTAHFDATAHFGDRRFPAERA